MKKQVKKLETKDIIFIMAIAKDLIRTEIKTCDFRLDNVKQELLDTLEYVIDNYHVAEL